MGYFGLFVWFDWVLENWCLCGPQRKSPSKSVALAKDSLRLKILGIGVEYRNVPSTHILSLRDILDFFIGLNWVLGVGVEYRNAPSTNM